MSTFYLTTPIYYVNASPHLGHAYTTILADAMARWRRLAGDEVWFLTGTDEHGDKIARAAAQAGQSPQAYTDRISGEFRQTWQALGITHDDFIRTTEPRHQAVVQRILQTLRDAGEIYLGTYGGHYCFGCERFYTEKEIVAGQCPDHRTPLTWIEEENYFFRMSKYQGWLIETIERRPDLIRPERYRNEILGFLRDPLTDLSISRPRTRLEWGIPLPFDDRYVTYVWFDALINYVSALGGPGDPRFEKFWPHAQHLIGKDILKPHAVYWPCMLKAYGEALGRGDDLLYRHLNVHGYWGFGGGKMSKSVGNVVEALALRDRYGNDALRYFVMREMVFGLDADFSEEAFVGRLNADLANDLGNLVARATTLLATHGGGRAVPWGAPALDLGAAEAALQRAFAEALAAVRNAMAEFAFHRALAAVWEFIGHVNRYVDAAAPWELAKRRDEPATRRLATVLAGLSESLRCLAIVLSPFLPEASRRIREALGEREEPRLPAAALGGAAQPVRLTAARLSGLFPRVDLEARAAGRAGAPAGAAQAGGQAPAAGPIALDEFARVELRVAEVLAAESVPKSKKLLKLTVSLGTEQRTVVAGIAEHYRPADLVGKKVVLVANLEPARLMGVESRGMILAATADGELAVVTLDRDLPPGARVR